MTVSMRSRAGKTSRQPLNRSRSRDGLTRVGRRPPKRKISFLALFVVFLFLVIVVAVATVHTSLRETTPTIRKRQLQDEQEETYYQAHNSDEAPGDEENSGNHKTHEQYDGGRYEEKEGDGGLMEDIRAAEEAIHEENEIEQAQEEQIIRDEEAERAKEEEIRKLKEEKARLEQQLREEEERRRKEEDIRRQKEEEERERQLQEEERRKEEELHKLEEEKIKLQQQLREDEVKKQQEAELSRQRQAEAEQRRMEEEQARQKTNGDLDRPEPDNDNKDVPEIPNQPKIDFCDFMRKKPDFATMNAAKDTGFSNPAVLLLGTEDTSTDLIWHVFSQILHPERATARRTQQLFEHASRALDYSRLNHVFANDQEQFWTGVSDRSGGKWMIHVFCQQQQHDIAAGFPWITSPNVITENNKAKATLELIKQLPKGALKILRIKRNLLDVAIRHAQLEQAVGKGDPVQLDRKKIFKELYRLQIEQDAVDNFLHRNKIPHLALEFETLFPFDEWTHLVQNTQVFQQYADPINVDWRQLATQLEATWRDVLRYVDIYKPLTMYDILRFAMQTHEAHSFWTQRNAVKQFPYIQNALQGTHYQQLIRKDRPIMEPRREIDDPEMRHDLL